MEKAFEKCHPFVVTTYFVISTVLVMYLNHPLFLIASYISIVCSNHLFYVKETIIKAIKGSLILGGLIFIMNCLFNKNGSTVVVTIFGNAIMLEVIVYSLLMAFMILIVLQMSLLFNSTLNGSKLMFVISKVLPKTGLVTMLALRYIPLLKSQLHEITTVQKMRGHSITEGKLLDRIKSALLFVQMLLTISLEDALQTADSMKARGYGQAKERTSYTKYSWTSNDTAMFIVLIILFSVVIVWSILGAGVITVYPKLPSLWSIQHVGVSLVALLILSFPLILQSMEWFKWKLYSLKM